MFDKFDKRRDEVIKAEAREILARIKADDARYSAERKAEAEHAKKRDNTPLPTEVIAGRAKLAAARARREEDALLAGMNPKEHADYLNAKESAKSSGSVSLQN